MYHYKCYKTNATSRYVDPKPTEQLQLWNTFRHQQKNNL